MQNDESLPKAKQGTAPPIPEGSGSDSLDFSHIGPGKAAASTSSLGADVRRVGPDASSSGNSSGVRLRKKIRDRGKANSAAKAGSSRRLFGPLLIIITIGAAVAYVMSDHFSEEPVAPSPSAKRPSRTNQSPLIVKTPKPDALSPKGQTPLPESSTPPPDATGQTGLATRAIPADFLKAFQEYVKQSGGKAMALALDKEGRWAYGSISSAATHADASKEALSECSRFKADAGIQADCRLYAVGDKVVW